MTEQEKKQSIVEENLSAAVDEVAKTAESAATLGRKVTALWLGVTRTAIDAATNTLKSTAEMISGVAKSMGELSKRVDDSTKKA